MIKKRFDSIYKIKIFNQFNIVPLFKKIRIAESYK